MSLSSSSRNSINDGDSENLDYSVYSSSSDLELDIKTRDLAQCAAQQWKLQDLKDKPLYQPESLSTMAAKVVAAVFPFEAVENSGYTIPEELQKLIAFHSFPTDEYPIWLYSNLSCGGCSQFFRGEQLWAIDSVKNCVQVGFHLNATVSSKVDTYVNPSMINNSDHKTESVDHIVHHVAITFDRKRITSCSCTCITDLDDNNSSRVPLANVSSRKPTSARVFYDHLSYRNENGIWSFRPSESLVTVASNFPSIDLGGFTQKESRLPKRNLWSMRAKLHNSVGSDGIPKEDFVVDPMMFDGIWCAHIVAVCLARIREPEQFKIRAPISESLSKLNKEDLQKFAQYLIVRMGPKRILPGAQRIIDDLLSSEQNSIKNLQGAPDPTAGGSIEDVASWCFDGEILREKILITLQRFCTAKMDICEDVGMLAYSLPAEVECHRVLLRSLRDKTPRGIWDLLQMIMDMLIRRDSNALPLLEILTRKILQVPEIIVPWYLVQHNASFMLGSASQNASLFTQKFASSFLCEQLIKMWRLVGLNPDLLSISCHEPEQCRPNLMNPELNTLTSVKPVSSPFLKCQLIRHLEYFHRKAVSEAVSALQKNIHIGNNSGNSNINRHGNANWRGSSSRGQQDASRSVGGQKLLTSLATAYEDDPDPPKKLFCQLFQPKNLEDLCSPISQDLFVGFSEAVKLLRLDLPKIKIPSKFSDPDQYRASLPIFNGVWVVSAQNKETQEIIMDFFKQFQAPEPLTGYHHLTTTKRKAFRNFGSTKQISSSEIDDDEEEYLPNCEGLGNNSDALETPRRRRSSKTFKANEQLKSVLSSLVLSSILESGEDEIVEVWNWLISLVDPCDDMDAAFLQFESISNYLSGNTAVSWARFLALCILNRMPKIIEQIREVADVVFQLLTSIGCLRRQQNHLAQSTPPPFNSEDIILNGGSSRKSSRSNQNYSLAGSSVSSTAGRRSHHRHAQRNQMASQGSQSNFGGSRFNSNSSTFSASHVGLKASAIFALEQKIELRIQILHAICNLHSSWILQLQERSLSLVQVLTGSGNIFSSITYDNRLNNLDRINEPNQPQTSVSEPTLFPSACLFRQESNTFYKRNKWSRLDVELAFRLGTSSLALPRLPSTRSALEVRLFDLESTILNLLCRLPLSTHCPHALDILRKEAKSLTKLESLDPIRKNLVVPFSLATYVFHQLAGAELFRNSLNNTSNNTGLSSQVTSLATPVHIGSETTGIIRTRVSEFRDQGTSRGIVQPLLGMAPSAPELRNNLRQPGSSYAPYCINYGAFVASSGIPLAKAIHDAWKVKNDQNVSSLVGGSESASLDISSNASTTYKSANTAIVRLDEESSFQAALATLRMRSVIPNATFGIFNSPSSGGHGSHHHYYSGTGPNNSNLSLFGVQLEAQRLRYNALALHLICFYKDDLPRLSELLTNLLNSNRNPSYHTPPLNSVLTLPIEEFIDYFKGHQQQIVQEQYSNNDSSRDVIVETPDESSVSIQAMTNIDQSIEDADEDDILSSSTAGEEQDQPITTPTFTDNPDLSLEIVQTKLAQTNFENTEIQQSSSDNVFELNFQGLRTKRMADIDSSAPETTSSGDTSPALRRKLLHSAMTQRLNSNSNNPPGLRFARNKSDHDSSASSPPIANRLKVTQTTTLDNKEIKNEEPPSNEPFEFNAANSENASTTIPVQVNWWEQYSVSNNGVELFNEATAFHMSDLAKIISRIAGGSHRADEEEIFVPPAENTNATAGTGTSNQNSATIHRNLQMASFLIGLYALGLYSRLQQTYNMVDSLSVGFMQHTTNWAQINFAISSQTNQGPSTTSVVTSNNGSRNPQRFWSWLSTQIVEIGWRAACVLYHSWKNHLTAQQLCSIGLKCSKDRRDPNLSHIANELCLLSLRESSYLSAEEINKLLAQCQSYSIDSLERGLLAVEQSMSLAPYGLVPEVHFKLAMLWFELHNNMVAEIKNFHHKHSPGTSEANIPTSNTSCPMPSTASTVVESNFNIHNNFYSNNEQIAFQQINQSVGIYQQPTQNNLTYQQFPSNSNYGMGSNSQIYSNFEMQNFYGNSRPQNSWNGQIVPQGQSEYWPQLQIHSSQSLGNFLPHQNLSQMSSVGYTPYSQNNQFHTSASVPNYLQSIQHSPMEMIETPIEPPQPNPEEPPELRQLQEQSHLFLNRAFITAMAAIKKLFLPDSTNTVIDSSNSAEALLETYSNLSTSVHGRHHYHYQGGQTRHHKGNGSVCSSNNWHNHHRNHRHRGEQHHSSNTAENDVSSGMNTNNGVYSPYLAAFNWNILWTLDIAMMLGRSAVDAYCMLILKCVQCPLMMTEICNKAVSYFRSQIPPPTVQSNSSFIIGGAPYGGYPSIQNPNFILPLPNHPNARLANQFNQLHQIQTIYSSQQMILRPNSMVESGIDTTAAPVDNVHVRLVDRAHYLFHRLFDQRMRFIGHSQTEWDELVDLVLKAHSLYVAMPSSDRSLTFNNLLHRINKHPKCSKELWDRIYAGLQTVDMKS